MPLQRIAVNQFGPTLKTLMPGVLMSCTYSFFKKDPAPLVLISKIYTDNRVAGLNLHYLTFPYVKRLLQSYCGNVAFSYQSIKNDKYIVNAFRSYKRAGLRQVKTLDCNFLMTILGSLRTLKIEEIDAIRKEVQKQLEQAINPKASDVSKQFSEILSQKEGMEVPEII